MRYALALMALAIVFNACASEAGNSGPGNSSNQWQPTADAGSHNDSSAQQADSSSQPQPDQQVVVAKCNVDPAVNGMYNCDGVQDTPITAVDDPEFCGYASNQWGAKAENTTLELPTRLIAKVGIFTHDCVRKETK